MIQAKIFNRYNMNQEILKKQMKEQEKKLLKNKLLILKKWKRMPI